MKFHYWILQLIMTLFQKLPRELIEELGYFLLARELRTTLAVSDLSKIYKTSLFWKHYFNHKCNCMRNADLLNIFRIGFDLQMPYLINISYRKAMVETKCYLENAYQRELLKITDRQVLAHFICESDWKLKRKAFHQQPLLSKAIKMKNLIFADYYFSILRQELGLSPNYALKSLIENNYKAYEQEVNNLFSEDFFLVYSIKTFLFHIADIIIQLPSPDWKYFHLIYDKIPYPASSFSKTLLFYATQTNNVEFLKLLLNKGIFGGLRKLKTIAYKHKYYESYNIIKEKIRKKKQH